MLTDLAKNLKMKSPAGAYLSRKRSNASPRKEYGRVPFAYPSAATLGYEESRARDRQCGSLESMDEADAKGGFARVANWAEIEISGPKKNDRPGWRF